MKRITLILLVLFSPVKADPLKELENIDISIHDAPVFPGKSNPLDIKKKNELKSWSTTIKYEEDTLDNGVTYFYIKWPEAEAEGAYPIRHCCTEVLVRSLKTSNKKWTFFGKVKVGDKESEALSALSPVAKKEKGHILYCGLNECIIFKVQDGIIVEAKLDLYLD
jgi:hypothetical protein